MISLRPYQREALDNLYRWYGEHQGNPCIEAPTGAGKSVLIAQFCKENLEWFPNIKILVVTHVKELIEQNYRKLLEVWPQAPAGINSASIGKRETKTPITFCGIQSIKNKISEFDKVDIIIVDEAHLIGHNQTGTYRKVIEAFKERNPKLTVIGFTATPYRLGHGMITTPPAIFNEPIIKTASIKELQDEGYLAKLRSKMTSFKLKADGVGIRQGDYIEKELAEKLDTPMQNEEVVKEVLKIAEGRKHILFFCCGVYHAIHVCETIQNLGETAEFLVGSDSKDRREEKIEKFKKGEVRCMTNVNVLSTGFDFPDIDCMVFMRPTISPGLYCQQAGRGLRLKSNGGDCLVLDFAGNVAKHGPITNVHPPKQGRKHGESVAPCKVCPKCDEIVHISTAVCPSCGYEWPIKDKEKEDKSYVLHNDDIQGEDNSNIIICDTWSWGKTKSRNGNDMIRVDIYDKNPRKGYISDYFLLWNEGYAGLKAQARFMSIISKFGESGIPVTDNDMVRLLHKLNTICSPPSIIRYEMDGKYKRITSYQWPTVKIEKTTKGA